MSKGGKCERGNDSVLIGWRQVFLKRQTSRPVMENGQQFCCYIHPPFCSNPKYLNSVCLAWLDVPVCVSGTRRVMWGCGTRCTGTRRPLTWRLTACRLTLTPDLMWVTSRSTAQWLLLLMKMVSVCVSVYSVWSCGKSSDITYRNTFVIYSGNS